VQYQTSNDILLAARLDFSQLGNKLEYLTTVLLIHFDITFNFWLPAFFFSPYHDDAPPPLIIRCS